MNALLTWLCLFIVVLALIDRLIAARLTWRFVVKKQSFGGTIPQFKEIFRHSLTDGQRHASSFIEDDDRPALVWFEGTREAAPDVKIRHADLHTGDISDWFDAGELWRAMTPREAVRVIGNTIGVPQKGGTGFLTTIVTLGGWAGSSLALGVREAGGRIRAKRLVTNAYLNRSHLVRSPAIPMQGGDLLVPAYFEARLAYGQLIRLNSGGHVMDRIRLGRGRSVFQPTILPLDETRAFALFRDAKAPGWMRRSETQDGGKTWTDLEMTPNPCRGSPVAMARLSTGEALIAHNTEAENCETLRLSLSQDEGLTLLPIHDFEVGEADIPGHDLRYPALYADGQGIFYLSFTADEKRSLLVFQFNEAWLKARLRACRV